MPDEGKKTQDLKVEEKTHKHFRKKTSEEILVALGLTEIP